MDGPRALIFVALLPAMGALCPRAHAQSGADVPLPTPFPALPAPATAKGREERREKQTRPAPVPAALATGLKGEILLPLEVERRDFSSAFEARLKLDDAAARSDLTAVLARTLEFNPRRLTSRALLAQNLARLGVAKSGRRLQASAATSQTENRVLGAPKLAINGMDLGGEFTQGTKAFQLVQQVSLAAELPITTGGRVSAQGRAARADALAGVAALRGVEQDLLRDATRAYLRELRAEQLLTIAQSNVRVGRERLRVARVLLRGGLSPRLDALRAGTDLGAAGARRLEAANEVGMSRVALNVLMGRAPETPLRLQSIVAPSIFQTLSLIVGDKGQGAARAAADAHGHAEQSNDFAQGSNGSGNGKGGHAPEAPAPKTEGARQPVPAFREARP